MKICIFMSVVAMVVAGCQSFTAPDMPATLQAENQQIILEATQIAASAQADREQVAVTAAAAMTEVANLRQSNQVLLATVRAGDPPEQRVVVGSDTRAGVPEAGQRWFMKTGLSQGVNEADGCVVSPQITFPSDVAAIYATLRGFNLEPQIQFSAQWEREGIEVYRDSFVLQQGASEICLWFSITQADTDLVPGNWSVRLFANGAQLESPFTFTVVEAGA